MMRLFSSSLRTKRHVQSPWVFCFVIVVFLELIAGLSHADAVPVRYSEGLLHGFLVLRTTEGTEIADGDWIQVVHGGRVTSDLIFHFKDGSLHRETAVFTQKRTFRLLSGQLVQKGPSFPHPLELSIDGSSGDVKVKYTDDGKEKEIDEHMQLPSDLSNGMVTTLLKNVAPDQEQLSVSMVVAVPKPRLIKLMITNAGKEAFSLGASGHDATRYTVKVELGGLTGVLAPLFGKQPSDTHVWMLEGESPTFVKSEGPFYYGGPIWRIELIAPSWPEKSPASTDAKDEKDKPSSR